MYRPQWDMPPPPPPGTGPTSFQGGGGGAEVFCLNIFSGAPDLKTCVPMFYRAKKFFYDHIPTTGDYLCNTLSKRLESPKKRKRLAWKSSGFALNLSVFYPNIASWKIQGGLHPRRTPMTMSNICTKNKNNNNVTMQNTEGKKSFLFAVWYCLSAAYPCDVWQVLPRGLRSRHPALGTTWPVPLRILQRRTSTFTWMMARLWLLTGCCSAVPQTSSVVSLIRSFQRYSNFFFY